MYYLISHKRHMAKIHAREILCIPNQRMGGKYLVTNGVAWHSVSHTNAAQ